MSEEELVALLQILGQLPGNSASQRFNYLQDISGTAGLDLFGTKQEAPVYTPSLATQNQTALMYGNDPTMQAIFAGINKGLSPYEAVARLREQGLLKDEKITKYGSTSGRIDYDQIALDYAKSKVAADAAAAQERNVFDQQVAQFERDRPATMQDIFRTTYEAAGAPSVDRLVGEYGKKFTKAQGSRVDRASTLGAKRAKPSAQQPAQAMGGRPSEYGFSGTFSNDPEMERAAQGYARWVANKNIDRSKKLFVPTDKGSKALDSLMLLNALKQGL